jgi:hypothetical protein
VERCDKFHRKNTGERSGVLVIQSAHA